MSSENTGFAPGRIDGPVYFVNSRGEIHLPPTTEDALRIKDAWAKRGFQMCHVETLSELDRLQKRMEEYEMAKAEFEQVRDDSVWAARRSEVVRRLTQRMRASHTSPYERQFIENYLQLRYEKREKYQKRFLCDRAYFLAREFDDGGKGKIAEIEGMGR